MDSLLNIPNNCHENEEELNLVIEELMSNLEDKGTPSRKRAASPDWQVVAKKKKNKDASDNKEAPRLNKFKILATSPYEGYKEVSKLEGRKERIVTKTNLKGEWILTPLDIQAYNFLKSTSLLRVTELKHEEKEVKGVLYK